MAPRKKPRKHTITLEKRSDGSWGTRDPGDLGDTYVTDPGLVKSSPFRTRSPAEIDTLSRMLNLKVPPEGVDIRPSLASRIRTYEHPPVPGSVGKWQGKGTRNDPYHWVGISEKVAASAIAVLLVIWGLEVIETDVSNWWSNSSLNVGNDLTTLSDDVLNALGFPVTTDSSGQTTAVGVRQHSTFWTWLFQQVVVQGSDLDQAVFTVNGLSTGFTTVNPPGSTGGGGAPGAPPNTGPYPTTGGVAYTDPNNPPSCPVGSYPYWDTQGYWICHPTSH